MKAIIPLALAAACWTAALPASAGFAKALQLVVVDLDAATFEKAPWLNQSHFLVIRSTEDPALKWIENLTGKKLGELVKKQPLLIYHGSADAEYFVSEQDGKKTLFLNIGSLKERDPLSSGLTISIAALPRGDFSVFKIGRIEEDVSRLGGGADGGFGGGTVEPPGR